MGSYGKPLWCSHLVAQPLYLAIKGEFGARVPEPIDPAVAMLKVMEAKLKAEATDFTGRKPGGPKGVPQIFPSNGRIRGERNGKGGNALSISFSHLRDDPSAPDPK